MLNSKQQELVKTLFLGFPAILIIGGMAIVSLNHFISDYERDVVNLVTTVLLVAGAAMLVFSFKQKSAISGRRTKRTLSRYAAFLFLGLGLTIVIGQFLSERASRPENQILKGPPEIRE